MCLSSNAQGKPTLHRSSLAPGAPPIRFVTRDSRITPVYITAVEIRRIRCRDTSFSTNARAPRD
jgi:hypothetical protein